MVPAIALIVILVATLTGVGIVVVRNMVQAAYMNGQRDAELRVEMAWDDGAEVTRLWYESGKEPGLYPSNPHRVAPRI